MRRSVLLLALTLSACGGATPNTDPLRDTACRRAADDAALAWNAVADRADSGTHSNDEHTPIAAETALDRIEAHEQALTAAPREITGEEALAVSNAVMDAVDDIAGELPFGLRERADDAAEALLTDRDDEGALRAARNAIAVLEDIVRVVDPGSSETRGLRRALSGLARRARDAATAYGQAPGDGDQRADRAQSVELPENAPPDLGQARDRAIEASDRVRSECRISRRLAVPSI